MVPMRRFEDTLHEHHAHVQDQAFLQEDGDVGFLNAGFDALFVVSHERRASWSPGSDSEAAFSGPDN